MEQDKAIALKNLTVNAYKAYVFLMYEKNRENINIEKYKSKYSTKQFELCYNAFLNELNNNILEYRNYQVVKEYINIVFGNFRKFNLTTIERFKPILKGGYEVSFLTLLLKLYKEYYQILLEFKDDDYEYNPDCKLYKYYNEIIDSKENNKSKPEYSLLFNFDSLICHSDNLDEIKNQIKLINDRLFMFKQWQVEFDEKNVSENGVEYRYSEEYYPNFEELCKLELERLYKKLDFFKLIEVPYQAQNVQAVTENSKNVYRWNSGDTDLLELITALFHSNAIKRKDNRKITRKELMNYFQEIFDMELKHAESKLSKISDRKKSLTPFIDKLKINFENFVEDKDDKQRERR